MRYEREFPDDPADARHLGRDARQLCDRRGRATAPTPPAASRSATTSTTRPARSSGACDAYLWATGDSLRDNPDLDPPLDGPIYVARPPGHATLAGAAAQRSADALVLRRFDGNTDDDQATEAGPCRRRRDLAGLRARRRDLCRAAGLPSDDYEPDCDDDDDADAAISTSRSRSGRAPTTASTAAPTGRAASPSASRTPATCPIGARCRSTTTCRPTIPAPTMNFWPQPPWRAARPARPPTSASRGPVLLYPGDGVVLHEVGEAAQGAGRTTATSSTSPASNGRFWVPRRRSERRLRRRRRRHRRAGLRAAGRRHAIWCSRRSRARRTASTPASTGAAPIVVHGAERRPGQLQRPDPGQGHARRQRCRRRPSGPWACAQAGPVLTCNIIAPPVNVPPGWTSGFLVTAHVPEARRSAALRPRQQGQHQRPGRRPPTNIIAGNDFDSATTHDPRSGLPRRRQPVTDIQVKKTGLGCGPFFTGYACEWQITVTNVGPDPYIGPFSMNDTIARRRLNTLPTLYPFCSGRTGSRSPATTPVRHPSRRAASHVHLPHALRRTAPPSARQQQHLDHRQPNPGLAAEPGGQRLGDASRRPIPNPACAPAAGAQHHQDREGLLRPIRRAPDWLCKFDIKVKNYGAGAAAGPDRGQRLQRQADDFQHAGLRAARAANRWQRARGPAPLNAGRRPGRSRRRRASIPTASRSPTATSSTPCGFNPAVGGDPGHLSQANQKVPQLFINRRARAGRRLLRSAEPRADQDRDQDGQGRRRLRRDLPHQGDSTGPDPYNGTVELDELLPDGTTYVSSSWPCVPTTGNDVHCSSPYKDIPVGKYTTMTITIHIPEDVAMENKCDDRQHRQRGDLGRGAAQRRGRAVHRVGGSEAAGERSAAKTPPQCPVNQVMPDGGCCEEGTIWNGKQCAPPRPVVPGRQPPQQRRQVRLRRGTEGKPGSASRSSRRRSARTTATSRGGKCVCARRHRRQARPVRADRG